MKANRGAMAVDIDMAPTKKHQPNFTLFFFEDPASEYMQIPSDFGKYLTEPLPKKVVLRNISGNLWTMMLNRIHQRFFFKKGWKKFATDNGLTIGESLLLEYDGIRFFSVRIFGQTGCEVSRCEVEIVEIGNDEDELEKHSDRAEKTDSKGEKISSGEKQCQRLQGKKKKAHGSSTEAWDLSRGRCSAVNFVNVRKYLSNVSNPVMVTRLPKRFHELHVKSRIIKDHHLKFPKVINFIDLFGKLKGRTVNRGGQNLRIMGFISICRRNKLATNDEILCEFEHCNGWVHSIKIHPIREGDKAT